MVEHRAPTVQQTLQRMIVESAQLQDYILPIGAQYRETGSTRKVLFLDDGNRLTMQMPEGRFRLPESDEFQYEDDDAISPASLGSHASPNAPKPARPAQ